jgi:uncharacterized protein YbjT (DUF2867 family)
VLVIGGTSGVGQLVSQKLSSRQGISVRVSARNPEKAREILDIKDNQQGIQIVRLDLTADDLESQLDAALRDVSAVVISVGTTAFPTQKWNGGNTPAAIDKAAVIKIAEAAGRVDGLKKVVLVTSVGVSRTKEMPFLILNLFGVLDAKRAGEEAIKESAKRNGFEYAILRPGRLVGGPFTNLDVAKLLQTEGGAENGVDVASGDALLGDCKRDACAETIIQCLTNDACSRAEFSIVSNEKPALTDEQWTSAFLKLKNEAVLQPAD